MSLEEIYRHQPECLQAMSENTKGVIVIPTGGGKSRIEFEWAKSKMVRNDGVHQIVLIVAPRIILCQQLIVNFYKFMKEKGDVKEMITFVSSGKIPTFEIDGHKVVGNKIGTRTGEPAEIRHLLKMADVNGKDSVIFSTYKSLYKAIEGIKLNIADRQGSTETHLVADEAHYFTREDNDSSSVKPFEALFENLDLFDTRFFFTATPKVKDDERSSGLNNSNVFGDVIHDVKPKDLIERGVICKPMLHSVILPDDTNLDKCIGDLIYKCFRAHEDMINGNVQVDDPEIAQVLGNRKRMLEEMGIELGGKVLVSVSGSKQLSDLIKWGIIEKMRNRNIHVAYTMSKNEIGTKYNEEDVSTDKLLKKLYNLCYRGGQTRYKTKLIVIHYDQLTEGIDVPVLTGMMPLREMNKIKKVQNIGRVLRALKEDQAVGVDNINQWIKPYSYIIVPKIENARSFEKLMDQLEGDYDSNCVVETSADAIGLGIDQLELQGFEHQVKRFRSVSRDIRHLIAHMNENNRRVMIEVANGNDPDF